MKLEANNLDLISAYILIGRHVIDLHIATNAQHINIFYVIHLYKQYCKIECSANLDQMV